MFMQLGVQSPSLTPNVTEDGLAESGTSIIRSSEGLRTGDRCWGFNQLPPLGEGKPRVLDFGVYVKKVQEVMSLWLK